MTHAEQALEFVKTDISHKVYHMSNDCLHTANKAQQTRPQFSSVSNKVSSPRVSLTASWEFYDCPARFRLCECAGGDNPERSFCVQARRDAVPAPDVQARPKKELKVIFIIPQDSR